MNGNNTSITKADSVLLKTIARAYHWAWDLMSGRTWSVEELAEHHQIGPRYVRRLLQVAFLAPKIVEGIALGHPSRLGSTRSACGGASPSL